MGIYSETVVYSLLSDHGMGWLENSNKNSCVVHIQRYQGKHSSVSDGPEPLPISSILKEQRYLELYKYGGVPRD